MIKRYTPLLKEILWYVTRGTIVRFSNNSRLISSQWAAIRGSVLARDKYTCQDCGVKDLSENLNAHHIKPVWNDGTDTESNLITLCYTCHQERHKKDDATEAFRKERIRQALTIPHLCRCACGCNKLFIGKINTRYKPGHHKQKKPSLSAHVRGQKLK